MSFDAGSPFSKNGTVALLKFITSTRLLRCAGHLRAAMGRPDRRKVGSIFVEIGDEHSETAMAEVLSVDYDEAGLYGREFDDVSDEEAPAAVAARACKEHVSVATRVFFRELEHVFKVRELRRVHVFGRRVEGHGPKTQRRQLPRQ